MAKDQGRNVETDELEMDAESSPKRKVPWMTAAVIGGILLLEGLGLMLFMWLKGPASATAEPIPNADGTIVNSSDVEHLLVEGKAPNTKRGATFVYRYSIYGMVEQGDIEAVKKIMEKRKASVESRVRQVIARMEPKELDEEPELTTLKRLLIQEFEQIFGPGRIRNLVISNWIRHRADY
jgi:flagellar basal body-associated protein FliL